MQQKLGLFYDWVNVDGWAEAQKHWGNCAAVVSIAFWRCVMRLSSHRTYTEVIGSHIGLVFAQLLRDNRYTD